MIRRPENLFLLASIIVLTIPIIVWGRSVVIDLLGFTIFIDNKTIIYFLGVLMIFYWIIYRIFNRYLINRTLTWIHILLTIGVVDYFLLTENWILKAKASSEVESYIMGQLMMNKERLIHIKSLGGIIFIIGQLALISNLINGLCKGRNKKHTTGDIAV